MQRAKDDLFFFIGEKKFEIHGAVFYTLTLLTYLLIYLLTYLLT